MKKLFAIIVGGLLLASCAEQKQTASGVTKEQGGKDMDKKHGEIDKWLTEIGF